MAAVNGCDGAGLTLVDDDDPASSISSGDFVSTVDSYQHEIGEGACLTCLNTGSVEQFDAATDDRSWPRFAERAGDQGILACLAVPLSLHGAVLGARTSTLGRSGASMKLPEMPLFPLAVRHPSWWRT